MSNGLTPRPSHRKKLEGVESPLVTAKRMKPVLSLTSSDSDEGMERSLVSVTLPPPKTFHDMVHQNIELPYICYKIINTPQFSRLRNLKQLGVCYFVYPSASHNRFEHCIGTAYLAGKYCRTLQRNQPELLIDTNDILCLEIAGLCHDIGHGPFSHLWENFMERCALFGNKYSHEEISIQMFDFMIEDNKLWELFELSGLDQQDIIFIKEAIFGRPLPGYTKLIGREPQKYFLYQIISNDETKIDVDKFDYLLRDSKQLNITVAFEYERVMENTRVVLVEEEGESKWKLAYRQKIFENLEDLFRGRYRMHQAVYQHRVDRIVEEMVIDALVAAEPYFQVSANDGTMYKLSTAYNDPSAFMKLTDLLMEYILNWGCGGLEAAFIFNRIQRRDLYQYFGYLKELPKDEGWNKLVKNYPKLVLIHTNFNYGKGRENPLSFALFFDKSQPKETYRVKCSAPPAQSKFYIVYKTDKEETMSFGVNIFKTNLKEWAHEQKIIIYME